MDQLQKTMVANEKETLIEHPLKNLKIENKYQENIFPNFTIFYATQSNTAKKFSEKIQKDAEYLNIKTKIKNISELKVEEDLNKNALVLFFVATYGEGGPSDDAIEFNREIDEKILFEKFTNDDLNYSVFGLGSSKYEFFNQMAKKIDKNFSKRGLKRICEIGLGDDSKNINKDFEIWRKIFWSESYNNFLNRKDEIINLSQKLKLKEQYETQEEEFKIFIGNDANNNNDIKENKNNIDFDFDFNFKENLTIEDYDFRTKRFLNSVECKIIGIKELRKETINGSTLLITYNCDSLKYKTGDNIGVYPKNSQILVNEIIGKFNFNKNEKIFIKKRNKGNLKIKSTIPNGLTIEDILKEHLDLSAQITY
jgi:NADPH-ferrihemoprotein reductase